MIPIAKVIVSPTEPQGKNRKKVWMQKGKNLFDKDNTIIDGYYIDNSGNLISASNSWYQNAFIKVKSNTQYTISSGHEILRVCFYDNNKNYISRAVTEKTSLTFLTPSNCEYVKLSGDTSSIQILDLQLEQGPSKTYYEAHIEPKTYIKNSNDVYEELENKVEKLQNAFITKNYIFENIVLNSNQKCQITENISIDGYNAIGVLFIDSNTAATLISKYSIFNNTLYATFLNNSSNSINATFTIRVLYEKI